MIEDLAEVIDRGECADLSSQLVISLEASPAVPTFRQIDGVAGNL